MAAKGPLPRPRRRLNPELRQAAQIAMRERRPSGPVISQRAGFSHQTKFSALLHAPVVPDTPLIRSRFERVAEIIGFHGDVFLPETADVPEAAAR